MLLSGEHQGTLAKDQIRLRGKDGLLGNRLLIAKAVQRCNFISNVTLQGIVIIEHADDLSLSPSLMSNSVMDSCVDSTFSGAWS